MTNAINQLTVKNLKQWAADNRALAMEVCSLKALAECERERVNAYIAPVFAQFTFADEDTGEVISNPDDLYLAGEAQDELAAEYYAACDKAHRENGFTGPEGHCPALTAEHNLVKAENALLDSIAVLMLGAGKQIPYSLREKTLELALTSALGEIV